jgi:hypothetical protein
LSFSLTTSWRVIMMYLTVEIEENRANKYKRFFGFVIYFLLRNNVGCYINLKPYSVFSCPLVFSHCPLSNILVFILIIFPCFSSCIAHVRYCWFNAGMSIWWLVGCLWPVWIVLVADNTFQNKLWIMHND